MLTYLRRLEAMIFSLPQTPNSPVASGSSGGRKAARRIVLVCHGVSETNEVWYVIDGIVYFTFHLISCLPNELEELLWFCC